jgi:DNA-3-methyladenine glycosylase I
MKRCKWCDNSDNYVKYHDCEWGVMRFDDAYLFEMLLLESFQAGLSWKCVLDKRENFRRAFDNFDPRVIELYDDGKKAVLAGDKSIIRNKRKIESTVTNARIFNRIVSEYGSFISYLKRFWDGRTIYENDRISSELSDAISKDLYKRGMRFVGSVIIYSYLQAVGIIYSHENDCFLYKGDRDENRKVDK